jgi:hypothetical protein
MSTATVRSMRTSQDFICLSSQLIAPKLRFQITEIIWGGRKSAV